MTYWPLLKNRQSVYCYQKQWYLKTHCVSSRSTNMSTTYIYLGVVSGNHKCLCRYHVQFLRWPDALKMITYHDVLTHTDARKNLFQCYFGGLEIDHQSNYLSIMWSWSCSLDYFLVLIWKTRTPMARARSSFRLRLESPWRHFYLKLSLTIIYPSFKRS